MNGPRLRVHRWMFLFPLVLLLGCQGNSPRASDQRSDAPPLFDDMGSHTRPVTTASPMAQRYFDHGLIWTWSFNHTEAIRSFQHATDLDPQCAMAWWGLALAYGPHINLTEMDDESSQAAVAAIGRAQAAADAGHATAVERDLIAALAHRYAWPAPADRAPLDRAYAQAMKAVYERHPDDADVATLYAEALMNLWPWDLWTKDGQPRPDTPAIVAVLENVLEGNPVHPGANHLYIHAIEASPHPEKALAAADRLRTLVPASGHMVHMPTHIDVRLGHWEMAAEQNRRAMAAHRRYREISPPGDIYRIYMAHNDHFLTFALMMEGRSEEAIAAARKLIADIPDDYARAYVLFIDGYLAIATQAMMRFGRWDELLAEPQPPDYLPVTTAYWHFGRASALATRGDIAGAQREHAAFRQAAERVSPDAIMNLNPARQVLAIADQVIAAEIAFHQGQVDQAIGLLRRGVELEDELRYVEPPDWLQPVRHTLGAVLPAAGRLDEAEAVYRRDLEIWPENGWALFGLSQCLQAKAPQAPGTAEAEARFQKAWARADTPLRATCLCVL